MIMMYVRILRVHRLKTWKEQAETMTGRAAAAPAAAPAAISSAASSAAAHTCTSLTWHTGACSRNRPIRHWGGGLPQCRSGGWAATWSQVKLIRGFQDVSARGRGVITDRGSQIPSHLHIPITIFLSDAKMKLGLRHDVVLYRGAIIQRRGTGGTQDW